MHMYAVLSSRLLTIGNNQIYQAYGLPPGEFDRGRYDASALNDHASTRVAAVFARSKQKSPRRGPDLADDLRPPVKRAWGRDWITWRR